MRVKSLVSVSASLILALFLLYLSYGLVGRYTLSSFSVETLPLTYSVESIILPSVGRNRLGVSERGIKKSLESLPYISEAEVYEKGGVLHIGGSAVENGLIMTDGRGWYFYSDGLYELSEKDVYALSKGYLILRVDTEIMDNLRLSPASRDEKAMMNTLIELKRSSALITMAEYGNNNSSGYPLSLTLRLDSLSSYLVLENIADAERIEEALAIIENEYTQTGALRMGKRTTYVLAGSRLIETR